MKTAIILTIASTSLAVPFGNVVDAMFGTNLAAPEVKRQADGGNTALPSFTLVDSTVPGGFPAPTPAPEAPSAPGLPFPTPSGIPGFPVPSGIPSLPGLPSGIPSLPGLPSGIPSLPGLPSGFPSLPGLPSGIPSLPGLPSGFPSLPGLPSGPLFPIPSSDPEAPFPGAPAPTGGFPIPTGALPGFPGLPGTGLPSTLATRTRGPRPTRLPRPSRGPTPTAQPAFPGLPAEDGGNLQSWWEFLQGLFGGRSESAN